MMADSVAVAVGAILLIAFFSVLAAEAQARIWEQCAGIQSRLHSQRLITMGKAHCR